MQPSTAIDWRAIDTVLLDMDGTLLDLRFDNWFWLERVPERYAEANRIGLGEAQERLKPKFRDCAGTLNWYCIEYWTRELGLDIAALKREATARVGYLPGAEGFLRKLEASGKRRVLVTNAHPETLAIKDGQMGLRQYFDACYSAHAFAAPKEDPSFWPRLAAAEPFSLQRTLFVDDSLRVLHAAKGFGIDSLRLVRRPDSARPPQEAQGYVAVDGVAELM